MSLYMYIYIALLYSVSIAEALTRMCYVYKAMQSNASINPIQIELMLLLTLP